MNESKENKIPVVVFAGGSHSGKSTTLDGLRKIINPEYRVAFAPEVATAIFNGRPGDDISGENVYYRQTYIMRMQLLIESLLKESKPDIIIFDRGICDMHTYVGKESCEKILKYLNMTEDDLNSHYDMVLFFETIFADPNADTATIRIEGDVNALKKNSKRAYKSWENAKNKIDIPIMEIDERTSFVAGKINEFLGKDVFLTK